MTDTHEAAQLVDKHGDIVIRTELYRNFSGLSVNVRAHTSVEDFMRVSLGCNGTVDIKVEGHRYWEPVRGSQLLCYTLIARSEILSLVTEQGQPYRLDRIGYPLLETIEDPTRPIAQNNQVNISFLRLCGISNVEGVTFKVRGIYSSAMIDTMVHAIGMAQRQFYFSFMKPIRKSIEIVTQTLRV